jgi:hypothetical protein
VSSGREHPELRAALEVMSSTTVPLTVQGLEPTMCLQDLSRSLRRGRKPGEEFNREEVYVSVQVRRASRLT